MTTRNRQVAALTLACLSAALSTGCSNKSPEAGRPNLAPLATTAHSESTETPSKPTPQQTTPERPAATDGLTLAAGEAFISYYSDLLNYASDTGDTGPLLTVSNAGCLHCKELARFAKMSNGANGLLAGEYHEKVNEISRIAIGQGGHLGADLVITVGQFTSRKSPSSSPLHSKATTYFREVALSPQGGSWVMFELRQQEQ